LNALRELCGLLEQEAWQNFRVEETVLYPLLKQRCPELRKSLGRLCEEHEIILQKLKEFRAELVHFNANGESRRVQPLGEELASLLRCHGSHEADEILPLLQEYAEKSQ